MSFSDVMPERYEPPPRRRPSRAKRRRCRCGIVTIGGAFRCAACAYADMTAGEGSLTTQGLPVTCWCESGFVWCKPNLIKAGLTRSCGLPGCEAA